MALGFPLVESEVKEMMRRWEYFLVPKTGGSLLHLLARGWASLWAEGRHESALVLNRAQSCHSEGGMVPGRPGHVLLAG